MTTPPLDPKAVEALSKVPEGVFDFKGGKTPEELGLKPDPSKPPTQHPDQPLLRRGRLVVLFVQEYFRGEHRILLDRGGSLPSWRLPDEHSAPDFIQAHAMELFNTPIINCRQIGSINAHQMDLYVVTGDVLQPAGCVDHAITPKQLTWTQRTAILRFKTLQSMLIAFAQTRLEGWHIDDPATDEFTVSFKMQLAPVRVPVKGNPPVVPVGPAPWPTDKRFQVPTDPHTQEEYPDPCSDERPAKP